MDASVPLYDTSKRNNPRVYNSQSTGSKAKSQQNVKLLKLGKSFFARLFAAARIRGADLAQFISHGNHAYPPITLRSGSTATFDT